MIEKKLNIPWINQNGEKNRAGTKGFRKNQPFINEINKNFGVLFANFFETEIGCVELYGD